MNIVGSGIGGVSVVVPAYNEELSVGESLDRLNKEMSANFPTFEIILVSDGSTDQTISRASESVGSSLVVLELTSNGGKGKAIMEGSQWAKHDVVAICDADLDLHPEKLIPMIIAVQAREADVAIGSKRHPDSRVSYPPWRRLQSRVYQTICKLMFGLDVSDTQTGQKALRREELFRALPKVSSTGFAFDLDLLTVLRDQGNAIEEFPITLTYSYQSTISVTTLVSVVQETWRLWRRRVSAARRRVGSTDA